MSTLLSFLRALPALISLVREIWVALRELYEEYDRRKRAEELKNAIKEARETKDTTKLEKYFGAPSSKSDPSGSEQVPSGPPSVGS